MPEPWVNDHFLRKGTLFNDGGVADSSVGFQLLIKTKMRMDVEMDTLAIARTLGKAGMEQELAETVVDTLKAVVKPLATTNDIERLGERMKGVEGQMKGLRIGWGGLKLRWGRSKQK